MDGEALRGRRLWARRRSPHLKRRQQLVGDDLLPGHVAYGRDDRSKHAETDVGIVKPPRGPEARPVTQRRLGQLREVATGGSLPPVLAGFGAQAA